MAAEDNDRKSLCCKPQTEHPEISNRPGLSELKYRLGTHGTFLRHMMARLHRQKIPDGNNKGTRPLTALTTRDSDDPAIAMLDAWATAADVLTFYQERFANEGFLRTAKQRRSVLELARAIGYELKPGVAAGSVAAFIVDDGKNSPKAVTVETGTQIQSVPQKKDELPQTFETMDDITARVEWNKLTPRLTEPRDIERSQKELYLKGVDTKLEPGDAILFVGNDRTDKKSEKWFDMAAIRIVQTVTPHQKSGAMDAFSVVTWEDNLDYDIGASTADGNRAGDLPQKKGRGIVKPIVAVQESQATLASDNPKVFAFRQRAALFGYNAPEGKLVVTGAGGDGVAVTDQEPTNYAYLDAPYPDILAGSWLAFEKGTAPARTLFKVNKVSVQPFSRTFRVASGDTEADIVVSSKSTFVNLDVIYDPDNFSPRQTAVLAVSEHLELAEKPISEPVFGNEIVLGKVVPNPTKGQMMVVSGKPVTHVRYVGPPLEVKYISPARWFLFWWSWFKLKTLATDDVLEITSPPERTGPDEIRWHLKDKKGFADSLVTSSDNVVPEPPAEDAETMVEVVILDESESDGERTTLRLKNALTNVYDRTTVTISANAVKITHGESVAEVLGSGDGSKKNQHFVLKKNPLTYVSAETAGGAQSSLSVRVDDVEWEDQPSLYERAADHRCYTVRIDNEAKATVIFGDGVQGARLPTGTENVVAGYRTGIGPEGEVGAELLTLLKKKPLGIREVTNPIAATGAEAPQKLKDARENAPLTILTLDRVVSLTDFEDFARAFAGIGKAKASALLAGENSLVHITLADASGHAVSGDLRGRLLSAINQARDPLREVRLQSYEPVLFNVRASIKIEAAYNDETVTADIAALLKAEFSFEQRQFGQPVTAAEIMDRIHQVDGVIAVDLDELYRLDKSGNPESPLLSPVLTAKNARLEKNADGKERIEPAQLLMINESGIVIEEMD